MTQAASSSSKSIVSLLPTLKAEPKSYNDTCCDKYTFILLRSP